MTDLIDLRRRAARWPRARSLLLVIAAVGACGDDNPSQPIEDAGPSQPVEEALATGDYHACKLASTGLVYCWGSNTTKQLGHDADGRMVALVNGLSGAVRVAAGTYHTCATTGKGDVWCWGRNHRGQLGDGTVSDVRRSAPARVTSLQNITDIAAGNDFTCAVAADGVVSCWGGISTWPDQPTPQAVAGLPTVSAVAAGANHACALGVDGGAYCWGSNGFGQLGSDSIGSQSMVPVRVGGVDAVTRIAAGKHHACSVHADGSLRCWGQNLYGQLGRDNTVDHSVGLVPIQDVVSATAGNAHTCAVLGDGSVMCWGRNESGQLGDGTLTDRVVPVPVVLPLAAAEVGAGIHYTCAMLSNGSVSCWGLLDVSGPLGSGSSVPQPIEFPL